MGMHRRRRLQDDLGEMALDVISEIGSSRRADREVERAAIKREREERRERQHQQQLRDLMAVGAGLLAGGLVASSGVITVAAVGVGLLTGGVVGFALRSMARPGAVRLTAPPPRPAIETPRLDAAGLSNARADVVRKVLDEATADLRRLEAAGARLRDAEAKLLADRLTVAGGRLSTAVAAAPEKLALAQRAFTYHLPKAVYLAETLASLEEAGADEKRLAQARHVLARMENLFEKTALDLAQVDAREMDVELRLINQALDDDLAGERPAPPRA